MLLGLGVKGLFSLFLTIFMKNFFAKSFTKMQNFCQNGKKFRKYAKQKCLFQPFNCNITTQMSQNVILYRKTTLHVPCMW
jgi:hypothetical protein